MQATNEFVRGCGVRQIGCAYLACPLSEGGMPLEHFLIDPPIKEVEVDGEMLPIAEAWDLKPRGVKIMRIPALGDGYHVVDIVGAESYPNATDFLEEVRHLGLSRKISRTSDFSLLTRESRILIAHSKGWVDNHDADERKNTTTDHSLALIAAFPISVIECVIDRENNEHEATMQAASRAGIPVDLVGS